jgi:(p)ppGpp synthase/HD superfamily hydrolase
METEDETCAALLHDVVEDTDYTLQDLAEMGFGDAVIEALTLLTHDESVPYLDYVRKISQNPLATRVKLADLAHNSDISRLDHEPTEKDLERVAKYRKAAAILRGEE